MWLFKLYDTVVVLDLVTTIETVRNIRTYIFNSPEDRDTLEELIPTHLLCDYIKSCVK